MFIGREPELKTLDRLYHSEKFEFAVIYGRRRVGKTALINHFLEDKKAIYFVGVESNAKQNLENLSQAIFEYSTGISIGTSFSDYQTALQYVFQLAQKERLILVIDEYPYVAKAESSLASTLQMLIDRNKDSSRLMLILCGSSMSYMEDKVLAYKAPLYGRRTAQMKLLPFEFGDACRFWENASAETKALLYGLVGGVPQYILQMDDRLSIEENVKNTFLNPSSALFEEPENLLKQELREPALYNAIITAVAGGASRISEISTKSGVTTSACPIYMKSLIELGLLQKETPYGEKPSRKTVYSICDNMFRFWYRFVPENSSIISRGATELAYKRIEPNLSDYMGKVFEDICSQYLWSIMLSGRCPIEFTSLGRWWGNDPIKKQQTEIDLMGEQDKNAALFGECKWQNEKVDLPVLETLIHRSHLFHYTETHLYLFSKSGFTQGCIEGAAGKNNIHLITYEEMLANWNQ